MRRWVLLPAVVLLAAGPLTAPGFATADASCAPCLVVTVDGSSSAVQRFDTVALGNLVDIIGQTYKIRDAGGTETSSDPITGVSVEQLLRSLQSPLDPASVLFVHVSRPGGAVHALTGSAGEIDATSGTFDGGLFPAFFVSGLNNANIGYIRPLLANDPADANNTDNFLSDDAGELDVIVHTTAQVLHPRIAVDRTKLARPGPVSFAVSFPVQDDPPLDATYLWTFGDGTVVTTATPAVTHRYRTPGNWAAYLRVSSRTEPSRGLSNTLRIKVHSIPTGKKHNPLDGPNRGKGQHAGTGPSAGSTATPSPQPTGPSTRTPSAGGSGAARRRHRAVPRSSRSSTTGSSAPRSSGRQVNGFLLTVPGGALPAGAGPSSATRTDTAPAARRPVDGPVDLRMLWWLVGPVLLTIGMLRERRRPARPGARRHT